MARRRYRRYSRRRTGKYSPNITRLGPNSYNIQPQTRDFQIVTLVENEGYNASRGNNILRVKNVELNVQFETANVAAAYNIESCCGYILFIPEGYSINIDTPIQHPEWIMAYKFFGSPDPELGSITEPQVVSPQRVQRITSRLSRNLNTGDRIVFLAEATNVNENNAYGVQFQGLCRWWTKAN